MEDPTIRCPYLARFASCLATGGPAVIEAFTDLLANLPDGKLVYHEKFVCVAETHDPVADDTGFSVGVEPVIEVERPGLRRWRMPEAGWRFGGRWDMLHCSPGALSMPYAGWTVWTEPWRVMEVQRLAARGEHGKAIALTLAQLQ